MGSLHEGVPLGREQAKLPTDDQAQEGDNKVKEGHRCGWADWKKKWSVVESEVILRAVPNL